MTNRSEFAAGAPGAGLLAGLPDVSPESGITPKGPTGLLAALRRASSPERPERGLPVLDAATVGTGALDMFDYDVELALELEFLDEDPVR
jgi:hypothetical protein